MEQCGLPKLARARHSSGDVGYQLIPSAPNPAHRARGAATAAAAASPRFTATDAWQQPNNNIFTNFAGHVGGQVLLGELLAVLEHIWEDRFDLVQARVHRVVAHEHGLLRGGGSVVGDGPGHVVLDIVRAAAVGAQGLEQVRQIDAVAGRMRARRRPEMAESVISVWAYVTAPLPPPPGGSNVLDSDLHDATVLLADPAQVRAPQMARAGDAEQALGRRGDFVAELLAPVVDDAVLLATHDEDGLGDGPGVGAAAGPRHQHLRLVAQVGHGTAAGRVAADGEARDVEVTSKELQLRVREGLELGDGAARVALLVDLLAVAEAHEVVQGDARVVRGHHDEATRR